MPNASRLIYCYNHCETVETVGTLDGDTESQYYYICYNCECPAWISDADPKWQKYHQPRATGKEIGNHNTWPTGSQRLVRG